MSSYYLDISTVVQNINLKFLLTIIFSYISHNAIMSLISVDTLLNFASRSARRRA